MGQRCLTPVLARLPRLAFNGVHLLTNHRQEGKGRSNRAPPMSTDHPALPSLPAEARQRDTGAFEVLQPHGMHALT